MTISLAKDQFWKTQHPCKCFSLRKLILESVNNVMWQLHSAQDTVDSHSYQCYPSFTRFSENLNSGALTLRSLRFELIKIFYICTFSIFFKNPTLPSSRVSTCKNTGIHTACQGDYNTLFSLLQLRGKNWTEGEIKFYVASNSVLAHHQRNNASTWFIVTMYTKVFAVSVNTANLWLHTDAKNSMCQNQPLPLWILSL